MRWTLLTLALSTPGVGAAAASIGEARPPVVAEAPIVTGELDTPRFRILHTARAKGAARKLADEVESTRSYFDKVLGRDWPGTTEIRVGFGRQEFSALALPGDRPPDWSRAYSYPKENIIVLEASSLSEADGNTILRHELLHVALGQLGGDWPHWFHDGLAMFLTGQRHSLAQYAALFQAVQQDRIFSFQDLKDRWPEQPTDVQIAYAQSVSFVDFLVERHGLAALGELIDGVVDDGRSFETAFAKAFKASLWFEETAWRAQLPSRYSWLPLLTNSSVLWALLALACIAASLRLRSRRRRRRAAMEAAELAEGQVEGPPTAGDEANRLADPWTRAAANDDIEGGGAGGTHSSPSQS